MISETKFEYSVLFFDTNGDERHIERVAFSVPASIGARVSWIGCVLEIESIMIYADGQLPDLGCKLLVGL